MNDEIQILYTQPKLSSEPGKQYDITDMCVSFSTTTSIKGDAGKTSLVFLRCKPEIECGGVIVISAGSDMLFYGFVFTVKQTQDVSVSVECFDALRYLKNEVFYPWPKQTLTERFKEICSKATLDVGVADASSHTLKAVISEGKTLFSVLQEAIDETLQNEKKLFYVRANGRALELIDVEYDVVDVCIDSDAFVVGYNHEKSIDKQTYTQVNLWRGDDSKTFRLVASAPSAPDDAMASYGHLVFTQKIEGNASESELQTRAQNMLALHNRPTEGISINAFGNWAVHAGCIITISIPEIDESYQARNFIVTSCTHNYDHDNHMMSLQLLSTIGAI